MYLNKAMIYGNLTRDPELKALPNGSSVCSFSLATNRVYNDRDGKRQEQAEYHNVVVFGKQADNCAKYLTKGAGAYVEGRLQTRSWDKDGAKMYRTEVIAERVQFGAKEATSAPKEESPSVLPDYPEDEINPEDIPF
jgi:single-strand DNA-binding protein